MKNLILKLHKKHNSEFNIVVVVVIVVSVKIKI